ncbi:MAG: hypothetical protein OEN20_06475, partial [Gammaproteobacteria bacterium]|nr:hypothetical protein [Gammaproteobacteria bacterium]
MNGVYPDWQIALLCAALATPALAALLLAHPTVARRSLALDLAAWSALPACLVVIVVPDGYVDVYWLLLGTRFGLDSTGRVFLAFSGFLWLAAGIFARGYLRDDPRARRFFGFYVLSMLGNLGLVLAQDAVSFFVFFTLMSLAAYGLVIHEPTAQNLRAGRIYIVLAMAGEVLLFSALVLL